MAESGWTPPKMVPYEPKGRANRRCIACGNQRPIEEFDRRAEVEKQRRTCAGCRGAPLTSEKKRAKARAYYATSERAKRTTRAVYLRKAYGLTLDDYDKLLAVQGGACAICRRAPVELGGRNGTAPLSLAVDHNHTTGAFRGILCSKCNQGLGAFGEDPERLQEAIRYLIAGGFKQ